MICPVCQAILFKNGKSYVCENRHSFDIAKEGYVNLLLNQQKKSKEPGDSKEMMLARSNFLRSGYYKRMALAVCDMIGNNKGIILDAGCGEGYYTNLISENCQNLEVYGIDISKSGVKRGKNPSVTYIVGSIFHLPFEDNSLDVITNIFAPYCEVEFNRVLKKGGELIIVCAGREHLKQLRKLIYDNEVGHSEKQFNFISFEQIEKQEIKYNIHLEKEMFGNLFLMTPYYFQTPLTQKEKILSLNEIELTVDFEIYKFKKL